jgi:uncharacterized protein YcnI
MLRTTAPRSRLLRRSSLVVAATLISIPLLAEIASAHVVVTSPDAVQGGETALVAFRVPNESDKASTISVRIDLPVDHPVAEVMVEPIPGWTITTTERKLDAPTKVGDFTIDKAPESVTWTAESGTKIGPGEFQTFYIVINPVPNTPTLTFTATQKYDDGSVVKWNQPANADGSEAEFPSPELAVPPAPEEIVPSEPAAPSESAKPTASAKPTTSAKPTASATPSESVTASESATPSESAAPSESPSDSAPPSESAAASESRLPSASAVAASASASPIAAEPDSGSSSNALAVWIAAAALLVAIVSLVLVLMRRRPE